MVRAIKLIVGRTAFWVGWPVFWMLMHGTDRARAVIVHAGRVLLIRDTLGDGSWTLPGGGMQGSESAALAACREVYEELGVVLSADVFTELATERTGYRGIAYTAHFVAARLDDLPKPIPGIEVLELQWVPLTEVPQYNVDLTAARALALLAERG